MSGEKLRQHTVCKLSLVIVLLLASVPALVVAAQPPPRASLHPMVWDTIRSAGDAEVLVVFREQADLSGAGALPTKEARGRYVYEALRNVSGKTQQDLRALLEAQGADYQSFFIVNAIKVRADGARLRSLAARSDVAQILPNPWVKGVPGNITQVAKTAPAGIEANLLRVNADDVWALGYTGQGIVVAGQDTGYDWDHQALKRQYRGWNGSEVDHDYNWHDAIHSGGGVCGPDTLEPCDDYGHGTHTMGTIVGDDGNSNQIGMAPGAEWIGCRNMDEGYGTPATYMECFEFFLAPYPVDGTPAQGDPDLAPHVVNNSWSCPPNEGCDAGTLDAAVDALRQSGIVIVVSAGNDGHSVCTSVRNPPAIYPQSFTTGSFNYRDDQIAASSSRGPVTYDGDTYTKPDIAAPGQGIRSCVPGGGYGSSSGTSMAAPHVAGAVALLLSAAPGYSGRVAAIEGALTSTAEPKLDAQCGESGPPNNVWGWGILDALAAVESVTLGSLQGRVGDHSSGQPIWGAQVTAQMTTLPVVGSEVTTDSTGHYTMTLPAGTFDVSVRADGYVLQTVTDVQVISGHSTTLDFGLVAFSRCYLPLVVRDW